MKKIVALALAAAVFASVAAGCAMSNNAPAKTTATATTADSKPAVLRYWLRATGEVDRTWMDELLKDPKFKGKIENVVYTSYGENYNNVINMAMASGDPPELFEVQTNPPVTAFAEAGNILPITDLVTDDLKKALHPSALAQSDFWYKGELYTIPQRLQTYKLLYNKELFKAAGLDPAKPPKTLEEMRTYAKQITTAGKGQYFGFAFYLTYNTFWQRHMDIPLVAAGKSGSAAYDYVTGRFDFSKFERLFNFWVDMKKDGSFFPGELSLGVEQMRVNFQQGKVAMMIDGNWMSTIYAIALPNKQDWDAVEVPIFADEKRAKDFMACDITIAISKQNKYTEQSKLFYKVFIERMSEARPYQKSTMPSTLLSANTKESFDAVVKKYPDLPWKAVTPMADTSNNAAFKVEPHKFLTLEGDNRDIALNNLYAQAIEGKANVSKSLADLTARYNKALDKALADGKLKKEDIQPAGFDYYKR